MRDYRSCGEVSISEIEGKLQVGLRPGAKAVFYDRYCRVLFGHLPEGYPSRFNLPGGGIDEGETVSRALVRECDEEMEEKIDLVEAEVAKCPILIEGELPFARTENGVSYRGKYEYIIGVPVPSLLHFQPKHDSKLVLLPAMSVHLAIKFMDISPEMDRFSVLLYRQGFKNLAEIINR